jgi:hypothetical protein
MDRDTQAALNFIHIESIFRYKPLKMLPWEVQNAYMAGVLEGDGYFDASQAPITFDERDLYALEHIAEVFYGVIRHKGDEIRLRK